MSNKDTNSDNNPTPWVIGVVLILAAAIAGGLYWNSTGKVQEVRYEGLHYVSENTLSKQIKIPHGIHPDSLDFVGITKSLENLAYVKYARINTGPGGVITIKITERKPIALLASGQQRAYVDNEGIRLPQLLGKTPDVPILYGFRTNSLDDTLKSEAFKQVGAFLQELQKRKAADATISEVAWDSEKGIIALTNENGVKVIVGKGTDFSNRLRNWEAFYREIVRKKGINIMESVDLRFEDQIVMREK